MGSPTWGRANFLTRTWYLKQKNQLYFDADQPLETWRKKRLNFGIGAQSLWSFLGPSLPELRTIGKSLPCD